VPSAAGHSAVPLGRVEEMVAVCKPAGMVEGITVTMVVRMVVPEGTLPKVAIASMVVKPLMVPGGGEKVVDVEEVDDVVFGEVGIAVIVTVLAERLERH
jgi:hypothetical protein